MVVGGDRRIHVLGFQNNRRVESYEEEEGLSKMKGGKALVLDQFSVDCLNKRIRSRVALFMQ